MRRTLYAQKEQRFRFRLRDRRLFPICRILTPARHFLYFSSRDIYILAHLTTGRNGLLGQDVRHVDKVDQICRIFSHS